VPPDDIAALLLDHAIAVREICVRKARLSLPKTPSVLACGRRRRYIDAE
jgi:hypothetical protein